jgi:hypothetical protein
LTWNGGTPCSGGANATDLSTFYVAQVSTFSDSALTIPNSSFAAGQTVYLKVTGFKPSVAQGNGNSQGVSIFWLKPGGNASDGYVPEQQRGRSSRLQRHGCDSKRRRRLLPLFTR